MEGVQDLYITMKQMDFTLEDYEGIIALYNQKVRITTHCILFLVK